MSMNPGRDEIRAAIVLEGARIIRPFLSGLLSSEPVNYEDVDQNLASLISFANIGQQSETLKYSSNQEFCEETLNRLLVSRTIPVEQAISVFSVLCDARQLYSDLIMELLERYTPTAEWMHHYIDSMLNYIEESGEGQFDPFNSPVPPDLLRPDILDWLKKPPGKPVPPKPLPACRCPFNDVVFHPRMAGQPGFCSKHGWFSCP